MSRSSSNALGPSPRGLFARAAATTIRAARLRLPSLRRPRTRQRERVALLDFLNRGANASADRRQTRGTLARRRRGRRSPRRDQPRPIRVLDRLGSRLAQPRRNNFKTVMNIGEINMSCHDRLYRGLDPKSVARRWFFKQCGVGLGTIALGRLLEDAGLAATPDADSNDPLAPKRLISKPRRSASFISSWPGAKPLGIVRQQAATREIRRHVAAAGIAQRLSRGVHQPQFEAARPASSSSPSMETRARNCRSYCPIWRPSPTTSRSCGRCPPTPSTTPRPNLDEHRLAAIRPAEPGFLGHLRPGQRVAQTCPRSSFSVPARKAPAAAIPTGGAASCRPCIKASTSAARRSRALLVEPARRRARLATRLDRHD